MVPPAEGQTFKAWISGGHFNWSIAALSKLKLVAQYSDSTRAWGSQVRPIPDPLDRSSVYQRPSQTSSGRLAGLQLPHAGLGELSDTVVLGEASDGFWHCNSPASITLIDSLDCSSILYIIGYTCWDLINYCHQGLMHAHWSGIHQGSPITTKGSPVQQQPGAWPPGITSISGGWIVQGGTICMLWWCLTHRKYKIPISLPKI